MLDTYRPAPLSEAELDALIAVAISETGASNLRDMGRVMAVIKERAAGQADVGIAGARVKAGLAH